MYVYAFIAYLLLIYLIDGYYFLTNMQLARQNTSYIYIQPPSSLLLHHVVPLCFT